MPHQGASCHESCVSFVFDMQRILLTGLEESIMRTLQPKCFLDKWWCRASFRI